MKEPAIVINKHPLSQAQSMTLRVALESFSVGLINEGLGDDEHGKRMTRLYLDRIAEIRKIIYSHREPTK